METWRIRFGTDGDAAAVLALWREAEGPPTPTDSDDALRQLIRRDPASLLLASADETVVGSLIAAWDGWRGSFYRLAVDPAWRRQKIATALVRAGEERLRGLGAARLTAIAVGSDRGPNDFWRSAGYELQADRNRFVRMVDS